MTEPLCDDCRWFRAFKPKDAWRRLTHRNPPTRIFHVERKEQG